jgi:hypothetical protein
MDKKIVLEWVEALESGEYHQAMNRLHSDGGFCCLGVAVDIAMDDWWVLDDDGRGYRMESKDGCLEPYYEGRYAMNTRLDQPMLDLLGLDVAQEAGLMALNDHGRDFAEIAAYIRRLKRLPKLAAGSKK